MTRGFDYGPILEYVADLAARAGLLVDRCEPDRRKVFAFLPGVAPYRCDLLVAGIKLEVSSQVTVVSHECAAPFQQQSGVLYLVTFPTRSGTKSSLALRYEVTLFPDATAVESLRWFREQATLVHHGFVEHGLAFLRQWSLQSVTARAE